MAAHLYWDMSFDRSAGTQERVGIDYPDLVKDCQVGDTLLLDDGLITMKVIASDQSTLSCQGDQWWCFKKQ